MKLERIERIWFVDDVRKMCIRNNYCNNCDNDTYADILDFVAATQPTEDNLITLSCLISYATDREGESMERYSHEVLFEILNNCIRYMPIYHEE